MEGRDYQLELSAELIKRNNNTLVQLDTGAGKTWIIEDICKKIKGNIVVIAHTKLLVKQLKKSIKNENVLTIGVRTLILRGIDISDYTLIIDEAHHVAEGNQWHKAAKKAKRTIGFTATPHRLDGEPLTCVFDELIQADSLKKRSVATLINRGILSDFVAYSALTDSERYFDSMLKLGRNDYTKSSLTKNMEAKLNLVCSSVIREYKEKAFNKSALCFCVSVDIATKQAESFNQAGIRSAVVSSKHSSADNARNIQLFEEGFIKILCHVDMFGEGIDIPALECVILTRLTASLSLYRQWCGRALRVFDGKDKAIILDHVGNIAKHGLPDRDIKWHISGAVSGESSATKRCKSCGAVNKFHAIKCSNCGEALNVISGSEVLVQHEETERRLIYWEREQELQKQAEDSKAWRANNVINEVNINAPAPLKKVLINRIINPVIDLLKKEGCEIFKINKMLENTKDYKVWIDNFQEFDLSNYRGFYDKYSK